MKSPHYALILFSALFLLSCGKSSKEIGEERTAKIPTFLLVEKIIKGKMLGERLDNPVGLSADITGSVVICDAGNHRLLQLDEKLEPFREAAGYGTTAGLLNNPTWLTYDNGLNLYVADESNRRIARFDSRLNFVDQIDFYNEDDPLLFGTVSGVAVNDFGETWVADAQNNQIVIFNNVGEYERVIGDFGFSGGQLRSPEKIIMGDDHEFIVCDGGNSRLVVYDSYGNFDYEIKNELLSYPAGVAKQKNLFWVVDRETGQILLLDRYGKLFFESPLRLTGDDIPLSDPSDILILDNTHLLISDTGNDRVLFCRIITE